MANHCRNTLTITHPDAEKITSLVAAMKNGTFAEFIAPIPQSAKDASDALEVVRPNGIAFYPCSDEEREAQIELWGTKWMEDFEVTNTPNTIQADFLSAWSPPIPLYESLHAQGYGVTAYYFEPGMGFGGRFKDGLDDEIDTTDDVDVATVDKIILARKQTFKQINAHNGVNDEG